MCIKKLPPYLAIQLKRFDYDWERECAIKFNDYFEFPRELDMEPYTVQGLAKIEGKFLNQTCLNLLAAQLDVAAALFHICSWA
jgi:ubiquitin carboxyl-terminal hydrolase 9/24